MFMKNTMKMQKTNILDNSDCLKLDLMQRMLDVKREGRLNSTNYKNLFFSLIGGNPDSMKFHRDLEKVWNCRISANDEQIVKDFETLNRVIKES